MPTGPRLTIGAIILCGGKSRRMGRPKAWLPFGSEVLLQRVVRLVGQGIGDGPVAVVAAPDQELPELPANVAIARDPVEGRGPLQGLVTGLEALDDSVEQVYAAATDVPLLEPRWIELLIETIGDADLAMPRIDGFDHPLAALYRRVTVLPTARALLESNRLRPVFLLETLTNRAPDEAALRRVDPALGTIRNLNTPDDYRQALRDAGLETAP